MYEVVRALWAPSKLRQWTSRQSCTTEGSDPSIQASSFFSCSSSSSSSSFPSCSSFNLFTLLCQVGPVGHAMYIRGQRLKHLKLIHGQFFPLLKLNLAQNIYYKYILLFFPPKNILKLLSNVWLFLNPQPPVKKLCLPTYAFYLYRRRRLQKAAAPCLLLLMCRSSSSFSSSSSSSSSFSYSSSSYSSSSCSLPPASSCAFI
jgi:hypothetical protein